MRPGVGVEITREPLGVVGLITPWNFPIAIPAWKIAPGAGLRQLRGAQARRLVPGSAWALAEISPRSGLPAGVFNLVMGRGTERGPTLLANDPRVAAISFTGSVATGRRSRAAAARDDQVPAGDGRQEPDGGAGRRRPGRGGELALNGAFFSTGQRCTASSAG